MTPGVPSITSIAENSAGGINAAEAANGTPVAVSLAGTSAVAGDTVTIDWGGQAVTYTLLSGDIIAGGVTVTVPSGTIATQGNGTFDVTARLTDIAGNATANSGAVSVTIDTVLPGTPSIASITENGSGGINAAEASNGTPVVVSLASTAAVAGDTVTVSWGGQIVSYTLLTGDIVAGSATVTVLASTITAQGDGTFNVTAKVTDGAGNVSATSSNVVVTVDTVTPAIPAITSIAENATGGVNAAEAANGTPVVVSLAGTGALAGDIVTVAWGGQTVAYTLLAGDIGAGSATVTVPAPTIAAQGDGTFVVTTKLTDVAGNVGASSPGMSVTVDTVTPPAPVVRPIAENAGGGINAVEAADGTPVMVDLFGTGALAGDTVTVSWGGQTVTYALLAGDIGAGTATVSVPTATIAAQGDGTFGVTAKLTDIAGNVSANSPVMSVTVDATAPGAPTIMSIVENGGGGIAASEVDQGTPVVVSLAGTGALAGNILTVTWGGQTVVHTLTGTDIVAGSVSVTVPFSTIAAQGNGTFNVTATLTDAANNVGSTSSAAVVTVDTMAPGAPSILSIEENDQGAIDAGEAMNGTPVVVSIAGTGAQVGDTLTVQWGQQSIDHVLVTDDIAGGVVTVSVSTATIAAQGDGTFGVTAKLVDLLGNSRFESPSVVVTVDTSAPVPPSIDAIPESGAGGIDAGEAADGTPVVVNLAATGALAGDTLTVNWGTQSVTYALQAADIVAGMATVTVTAATLAAQGDGLISVSAKLTDAAGNNSFSLFGQLVTVDTTVPGVPSIESVAEGTGGGINAVEAANGTPVVVTLSGSGASVGDSVVVGWGAETVSYVLLAGDVVAGKATVQVGAATLVAQGDGLVDVTAKLVDAVGNESAGFATFAVTVDTAAPGAPTIESVAEDADGGISHDEASDGTPVVVGLSGTGAVAGDTLTLGWGGQAIGYALTAADVAAGKATLTIAPAVIAAQGDGTFDVTAELTDAAGNDGASAAAVAVTVGSSSIVSIVALDAVQAEGDGVPTAFTFTVTLDHAAMTVRTVDWLATGSGLRPADLADFSNAHPNGTVTFGIGETSGTLTVLVSGDTDVEFDEGFAVALSNVSSGLMIGVGTASATIQNDDKAVVSIAGLSSTLAEGNGGTRLFTFAVSLDQASVTDQFVAWTVSGSGNHPAEAEDFAGFPAGSLVFQAGETSKTVTVAVSGDTVQEFDEGFAVALSQASSGLSIGTAIADGTIRDDDRPAVSVAVADAAKAEGDSATTAFTFTLSLDQSALADQTVEWSVVGAGAHAADGSDFAAGFPAGTATFAAGETSTTVTVLVSGDSVVEFDEGFAMVLANASSGLGLGVVAAAGTIGNDDASVVSLADLGGTKTGGNGGATKFTFTVSLDQAGVTNQTVDWSVAGTAAKAPGDPGPAGPQPVGTVQFAAGETSKTVSVLVPGDPGQEFAQGFVVNLSNASSGLALGKASATGAVEHIGTSAVSIAALSSPVAEGNSGTTLYTFTVDLDQAQTTEQSVGWSVVGTGAHKADATDFGAALPSGTLVFAAGETSKTLTVSVTGDLDVEFDESFAVSLTKASSGLTVGVASAVATIANEDKSTVSIAAAAAIGREGDGGIKSFTFTVSLDRPGASDQIVAWSVTGTGVDAADMADFGGVLPSGTVTFAAGETSRTVTVDVLGDTAIEPDESFVVTLSNASAGLTVLVGAAGGTIVNDDTSVSITGPASPRAEGSSGTTAFLFTVSRTGDLSSVQSVAYAVSGSGADPSVGADFAGGTLPTGTVSFASGEMSKTVEVTVAGDGTVESDETFVVALSSPSSGLALGVATASGTIVNDDTSVSIVAQSASQAEGSSGTTAFAFMLTRAGDLATAQSVTYSVSGSGASPAGGSDFAGGTLPSGTVTFAPNESSRTILIDVAGDTAVESDQTFAVSLSNASAGLAIATASASSTIANDDASVAIAALLADQTEGNAGTSAFSFTVILNGASPVAHSVTYTVTGAGPSPASVADFAGDLSPGTVVFQPGETSKTLVVQIAGDATVEPNETFAVTLSAPSAGLTITTSSATGTIRNDDTSGGDPVLGAVVANDDIYTGLQGQALHIAAADSVLFNDTGAPPLTVSLLSGPAHGTLSFASDGSFDYMPTAGFAGTDSFTYRTTGPASVDDGVVVIQVTPVSSGPTTTLDFMALSVEQQIAAVYTAYFGRGADADGFEFWVDSFNANIPTQGGAALLANLASAFGVSDEAKALHPFLADPDQVDDGDIDAFLDSVYGNLFARELDSAGLGYWSDQVAQRLAAGEFVGSVLVDIMNGAQNTPVGQDITTLVGKVTVNLEYVHDQQLFGTTWTAADDGAEATALLHAVTSDPGTVLLGIAQARTLVLADLGG